MKRLVEYLVTAWIIITVNFFLPRMMPGDPLLYLTGEASGDASVVIDEATRQELRRYFRLDLPLSRQYGHYLAGIFTGDLGYSIHHRTGVAGLIGRTLPWTLLLTLTAVALSTLLGAWLGALAAWRRGGAVDRGLTVVVLAVMAVPAFLLALLFQLLFSVKLGLFPVSGALTVYEAHLGAGARALDILHHAALPVAVLTLVLLPESFLLTRSSMLGVLAADYVLVARLKGLPERRVIYRHALRNALLPLMTQASLRIGLAVGGMIFVETVFSYPGMGELMYRSVTTHDYPVAQGVFLVITVAVLTINLAIDLAYRRIDPRVRDHGQRA